ncbi:polyketide synthase dehydratase domain-containing protein, partial [Kitasatospora sp. NPDC028055]|uniref:SpnB-like Rossmann fold domain-containing protein n=1 Tax=Kitasatospora sp. NPDC028055 TaxID=3155653 RepID=UPI00340BABE3
TLRRNTPETTQLTHALAHTWTHNTPTTPPTPTPPPTHHTPLPTYPFQHHTYWLEAAAGAGLDDAASAGLDDAAHPLLAAVVELPEGQGVVATGRIGVESHPWLAEYTLQDTTVLPAVAVLDLVLSTGDRLGLHHLDELSLERPLVLPEDGGVDLRVRVSGADEDGKHTVQVHTRQADGWTRRAAGVLSASGKAGGTGPGRAAWVEPEQSAERLTAAGYDHGGVFRSIRGFSDGHVETALPEDTTADGFGLHPALLAAALDGVLAGQSGETAFPNRFTDVTLHATGAAAARIRLAAHPDGTLSAGVADRDGAPLLSIGSVTSRALTAPDLAAAPGGPLDSPLALEWVPATTDTTATTTPPTPDILIVRPHDDTTTPHDPIAAAHHLAEQTLTRVQEWLAQDHPDNAHLVILTRGAIATHPDDPITDLPAATTWGLIRTAQNEHPHTLTLLDHHGDTPSPHTITTALTTGQPQLALRNGDFLTPRLTPTTPPTTPTTTPTIDPNGTILITGGTGTLAAHLARHLVTTHGARH